MSTSDGPSKKRPGQRSPSGRNPLSRPPPRAIEESSTTEPPDVREILAALREGNEEQALVVIRSLITRYQGPIPPASEMAGYEAASPGLSKRILALAEKEQSNTHALNAQMVTQEGRLRSDGQKGALFGLVVMLALAAFASWEKQEVLAGLIVTFTIIAVVAMFMRQQATIKNSGTEVAVGGRPLKEPSASTQPNGG